MKDAESSATNPMQPSRWTPDPHSPRPDTLLRFLKGAAGLDHDPLVGNDGPRQRQRVPSGLGTVEFHEAELALAVKDHLLDDPWAPASWSGTGVEGVVLASDPAPHPSPGGRVSATLSNRERFFACRRHRGVSETWLIGLQQPIQQESHEQHTTLMKCPVLPNAALRSVHSQQQVQYEAHGLQVLAQQRIHHIPQAGFPHCLLKGRRRHTSHRLVHGWRTPPSHFRLLLPGLLGSGGHEIGRQDPVKGLRLLGEPSVPEHLRTPRARAEGASGEVWCGPGIRPPLPL